MSDDERACIKVLNDTFRRNFFRPGVMSLMPAVWQKGPTFFVSAARAVANFDSFTTAQDTSGLHERGSLMIDGIKICFQIDYLDQQLQRTSNDLCSTTKTIRQAIIDVGDHCSRYPSVVQREVT
jgi:hypothetical protein